MTKEDFENLNNPSALFQATRVYTVFEMVDGSTFYKMEKDRYFGLAGTVFDDKGFVEKYGMSQDKYIEERFHEFLEKFYPECIV